MSSQQPGEMDRDTFVARFGGVFEHSPWIAEAAFDAGLGPDEHSVVGLHRAMCRVFRSAGRERQMAVVLAHPDLAGRLARAGGLTADSRNEQRSAGLDGCSDEELARFQELNTAYRERFGFPFIMAVKGRSRDEILGEFERRLRLDPEAELATAVDQIERIARLRLDDLLS
jgi:OHCU decarboxylase